MTSRLEQIVGWILVALFAVALQLLVPAFGDEPYFVSWGLTPSWGYYDHPPMPGWLSWLIIQGENLLGLAGHGRLHRLTYIAFGIVTFALLARYLRRLRPDMSPWPVLLAFAALPGTLVLFGVYFNDTLVGLFVLVFMVAVERALNSGRPRWDMVVLAGLAFGGALMTKYTAGLFYIAMLAYLLGNARRRRFLFGPFMVITLIAGALFLPNLVWNYDNCSVNLAFNFAFRRMSAGWLGLPLFVLFFLMLTGPAAWFVIRAIWRRWRWRGDGGGGGRLGYYSSLFVLIVGLTALLALSRGTYRMNWGLPYILFALMAAAEILPRPEIARLLRWNLGYLVLFSVPVLTLLALDQAGRHPLDALLDDRARAQLNVDLDLADLSLLNALRPFAQTRLIGSNNYGQVALMQNHGFGDAVVLPSWPALQVFGRNYDIFVDYQALDGRDFVLVADRFEEMLAFAERVFERVTLVEVSATRATHRLILGDGFRYEAYRQEMILPAIARFYDQSPFPARACYMDRFRDRP